MADRELLVPCRGSYPRQDEVKVIRPCLGKNQSACTRNTQNKLEVQKDRGRIEFGLWDKS
jgi:hypothetical protein